MNRFLRVMAMVLCLCLLVAGATACKPEEKPTDEELAAIEEASLWKLCEGMGLGETEARDVLDLLYELNLEGEVMFAFSAVDDEERIYYHVWIGEGTVDVYLDDEGGVAAVCRAETLLYGNLPEAPEEDEGDKPEDVPQEGEGLVKPMTITVEDYTATVCPGGDGYVWARGLIGVEYAIKVYYAGGASTAKALSPKIAAEDGTLVWEWEVNARVKPGKYKIIIHRADDEHDSITLPFEVLGEEV